MIKCKCGGAATLVGNFLEGYQVKCKVCHKSTKPLDKVGALKAWQNLKLE